ncbi:MAG: hypothetical protein ACI81T_004583, partial [Bacteroidia bacterium]
TILILIFCLIFIETNGQNGVAIKQRIQDIEIRGSGFYMIEGKLEIVENEETGEILFLEGNPHLGEFDSLTLEELVEAYSILKSNMLNGFYRNEKNVSTDENSKYYDTEYYKPYFLEQAFEDISFTEPRLKLDSIEIDYSDSVSISFFLGICFAKSVLRTLETDNLNSDSNYNKFREIVQSTNYFELDSSFRNTLPREKKMDYLVSQFKKVAKSNPNLAFFIQFGYMVEMNRILLETYISLGDNLGRRFPTITFLIAEQKLVIRYTCSAILPYWNTFLIPSSGSGLANDLDYLLNIYEGK